jgi:hypothetical protein
MKSVIIFIFSIFLSIYAYSMDDANPRVELALRMAGHTKLPHDALRACFDGMIQAINEKTENKVDDNLKDQIWSSISVHRIEALKKVFLDGVVEKILKGFNDEEILAMLQDHKDKGRITNLVFSGSIQTAMYFEKELIQNKVMDQVENMESVLVEEILQKLQIE